MLRKNWTSWVVAASVAVPLAASCGGEGDDGDDTNAVTVGMTMTPGSGDDGSAGDDGSGDDDGMMGTTAAPGDDDGADTMSADDAPACDPPCSAGQECIAGQCFGGDDTAGDDDDSGGGGCPAGETCQMTSAGTMACLGDPTHCVLPCAAGACPDPLACDAAGVCSYDAMNPPAEGHPDWPVPTVAGCPEGFVGAQFVTGFPVCIPECAAAAPQCPTGGVCAVNPTSSGMAC